MQDRAILIEIFKNSGLSENDMLAVISAFDRVEFKKMEFLLAEGQVSNEYFYLESGLVRSFAIDQTGNDVTTGFFSNKQLVLEASSLFLRIPTKENYQAL